MMGGRGKGFLIRGESTRKVFPSYQQEIGDRRNEGKVKKVMVRGVSSKNSTGRGGGITQSGKHYWERGICPGTKNHVGK